MIATALSLLVLIPGQYPDHGARVVMVDGHEIGGHVLSGSIPGEFKIIVGEREQKVASTDLDIIRVANKGRAQAGAWIVSLLGGSQLRGHIVSGDSEKLVLRNALVGDISFGLDLVSSITRADQGERNRGQSEVVTPIEDSVAMLSGDIVSRSVAEITEQGVKVGSEDQEQLIAWDKIRSLRMANDPPKLRQLVRVRLADGGILTGTRLTWDDDKITMETGDGQNLKLGSDIVSEIEPIGGRREWLSELPVHKSHDIPYFDKTWPMRTNANAVGGPLQLGDKTFSRGLGLHSAGRWTWQLGGDFARLRALVGIDDSAGPLADADFSVTLDGKQLFEWKGMKHKAPAKKVDLDVTGGRELTIEIDFGKNGMVQDRVDLVDAVLIKTSKAGSSAPQK